MRLCTTAWFLLALVGTTMAGPPASPPADKKLNPDLGNLPPNTWVKIKPNRNPEGRSFSGVCWGNGLIYYFGGGHHSYVGNDVELYDVAENTWTQATEMEDWRDCEKWPNMTPEDIKKVKAIGGGSPPSAFVLSPKGRPLTYHTYQCHVWFPEERAFYNIANWNHAGLWAFDPVKKEWREVTRRIPDYGDQSTITLTYDPRLKTVVALTCTRRPAAYVYHRETKAWTKKCDLPKECGVCAAYDSDRQVHVLYDHARCFTLDLVAGTTRPMKSLAEVVRAAGKPVPLPDLSLAYDPQSKTTVILNSDTSDKNRKGAGAPIQVWAYDADKDDWTEVKMSGPTPDSDVRWGLLVYDTDHKCFLFPNVMGIQGSKLQGGPVKGVWAFRLKRQETED